jgi:hypothetical protein
MTSSPLFASPNTAVAAAAAPPLVKSQYGGGGGGGSSSSSSTPFFSSPNMAAPPLPLLKPAFSAHAAGGTATYFPPEHSSRLLNKILFQSRAK